MENVFYHPWNQGKLVDDVRWEYGLPPAGINCMDPTHDSSFSSKWESWFSICEWSFIYTEKW